MIIVQGVFRSGTTLLFRTLRQAANLRCFYEPLHPDLLDHVDEALSDNPSHKKSGLYSEYSALVGPLHRVFDSRFCGSRSVLVDGGDGCSRLQSYLDLLAEAAPANGSGSGRVVLQFNRAFWMSRWLRQQYPDSCFLQMVRDPRSVVWSQFTTSSCSRVRMNWPILGRRFFKLSSGDLTNVFSPYAYHGVYQIKHYLSLGREQLADASDSVSQRAYRLLQAAEGELPYVQALALWGAQVWICHHQARKAFGDRYALVRYEDFVRAPSSVLHTLFDRADAPVPPTSRRFAQDAVRPKRVSRWARIPNADARFRDGIRRAGIQDVLDCVGNDLPAP